jgi:hypothetical protein
MGTHSTTLHFRDDLSEQGQLREVVRRLGETFNDPQIIAPTKKVLDSSFISYGKDFLI